MLYVYIYISIYHNVFPIETLVLISFGGIHHSQVFLSGSIKVMKAVGLPTSCGVLHRRRWSEMGATVSSVTHVQQCLLD